jgi:hypothetical protein
MPTGMVARMIIQASVSSTVRISNRSPPGSGLIMCPMEVKNPPMIRIQSR